jgi:hypothetical protein
MWVRYTMSHAHVVFISAIRLLAFVSAKVAAETYRKGMYGMQRA